jgi:hypothetical protein
MAGGKSTLSGDMAKGGWAGAYSRNIPDNRFPNGVVASVSCEKRQTATTGERPWMAMRALLSRWPSCTCNRQAAGSFALAGASTCVIAFHGGTEAAAVSAVKQQIKPRTPVTDLVPATSAGPRSFWFLQPTLTLR